jgi:arylsulfatase A-like enzyme
MMSANPHPLRSRLRTPLLLLLFSLTVLAAPASPTAPNIVFIFTDDHATQALSTYGGPLAKYAPTPNLDALAASGMRFDRCLVPNSICGPSRATILTGQYSHINGFFQNETDNFDGTQETFPKRLQASGYQTALIGKWHLGSEPTGFDHWEVLPAQGDYYNPDFITPAGQHRESGYVTDLITDKAIHWLEQQRQSEQPFLIMVQHKAPHRNWMPALRHLHLFEDVVLPEPPTLFEDYSGRGTAVRDQDMTIETTMELGLDLKVLQADFGQRLEQRTIGRMNPEQLAAWNAAYEPKNKAFLEANLSGKDLVRWKYQRYLKDYLRCIRAVDESVGVLRQWLTDNNLADNTIVVYASDQGFYLGEHGWFDKRFMFDESLRTPFIVSWPGVTAPGSSNRDIVSNLDFAQTFLEIAGLPEHDGMQGASLVPLLHGERPADWRQSFYYHYYEYPGWHMVHKHEGVYDGRYKLFHFYELEEWELYDLQTDPMELVNQYNNPEYHPIALRLHRELATLRDQYEVPANRRQSLETISMRYHSSTFRDRAEAPRR